MELIINDKKIQAYAYRDTKGLTKVELTEEVEVIGEGAFFHCHDLCYIKVGHHVKSVLFSAFEGISKNAHIIWLSQTPYKSRLYRILPGFENIASMCAPYLPFSKTNIHEKLALACGFILHPEYEDLYNPRLRENYRLFIFNELPQYLNTLVDNNTIIDIFVLCRKRHLIKDKETMKKFIAYARTRKTSLNEKKLLDQIESEEDLLQYQQADLEDQNIDKKLLRYIHLYANPTQMNQLLAREDLFELPSVQYKDSLRTMPEEALKFIMYQYIKQWSYFDENPPLFKHDEYADHIACLIDANSLQKALEEISKWKIEYSDQKSNTVIKYYRRLIPILRYCKDDLLQFYHQKSQDYLEYSKYKKSGMIASKTIQYGILLNQRPLALVYTFRNHMLNDYALLYKLKKENVFYQLVSLLDSHHTMALKEDYSQIKKEYQQYLYEAYVFKKSFSKEEMLKAFQLHILKESMQTLLWQIKDTKDKFLLQDDKINDIDDHDEMILAHPIEMSDKEIREWLTYFKNNQLQQFFPQIWIIEHRYTVEQMDFWIKRYFHLKVKLEKLQQLRNYHFLLQGSLSQGFQLLFYGKCILRASYDQNEQCALLSMIQDASYHPRELNEALHYIDAVLCFELIASGRESVKNHVSRFNEEEIKILLQKSIELHHQENVAILLDYQKQFIKQNDDLDLNW